MRLPLVARLYVGVVIGLGAAVTGAALMSVDFPRPGLFAALLALSVLSSVLKVDLPLGVGSSCISLSYAVGRGLYGAADARTGADDADLDDQRLVSVHVPDEPGEPGL
jgi:hypothetical protein